MEEVDIIGYIVRSINTGEEEDVYEVEYNEWYDAIDIIRHEDDKVMVYEITMETAVFIEMRDLGGILKEELDYRWKNS